MSPFAYVLPLVIWVGLLVVSILSVYVAWRSFFGDRGHGRRRCPKCWYDLAYSPGMTCGECGHVARSEAELQRTRRRPFIAIAAILTCVTLVLAVNEQMNQRGMLRHFPSRVLVFLLPFTGGMDGPVGDEIDRRAVSRILTNAQWKTLIQRCAEGDWLSKPPSDAWIENYGDFIENWRNRFVNDAELESLIRDIPPRLRARTRETWPEGVPIVVAVRLDDWWPAGTECRVRATPRIEDVGGVKPLTFFRSGESRMRPSPYSMYLPPLPAGDHEITIDFKVDRRRPGTAPAPPAADGGTSTTPDAAPDALAAETPWEPVGSFSVPLAMRVEGSLAALMQPVNSAALDAVMAQVFGNAVKWSGGQSPVRFGINAPVTFTPEFDDTAVGVSAELERDGVVARRLNLWWIAGNTLQDDRRNYGFEIAYENLEALRQLDEASLASGAWQLRIRSDPLLALRAGVVKQHWQGEFTTPIMLNQRQTNAPPRMWWTEGEVAEQP